MSVENVFVINQASHFFQRYPALNAFDTLPDSAYVPLPVVCALFACSPATIWRRVRDGRLVAPHRIGKRTTRWLVGQLRTDMEKLREAQ